jgi:hypothetical protein
MKGSIVESVPERGRILNAVALQNAVLCAECDVEATVCMIHAWSAAAGRCSISPVCWEATFRENAQY